MIVHRYYPDETMHMTNEFVRRVEIDIKPGLIVGAIEGDKIIILDADDSLDIIIQSGEERECIYSYLKKPEL